MLKEPLIHNSPKHKRSASLKDLARPRPFKLVSDSDDMHKSIAKWLLLTVYGILIFLMIYYSIKDADMHEQR